MLQNVCCETGKALSLESTEKFNAIEELINQSTVLKKAGRKDKLKKAVIERENQQSTGFGHGVAVAHGKVNGLKRMYIAMGVSRKGIEYNSYDGELVKILFVVANPPEMQQDYLKAICSLMNILKDPVFRNMLISGLSKRQASKMLFEKFSVNFYKKVS